MSEPESSKKSRRLALRRIAGLGTATALPLLSRFLSGDEMFSLISPAQAQAGITGARPGQAEIAHVPGASITPVQMAEWEQRGQGTEAEDSRNRIAQGKEAVDKAPQNASRYEAKTYDFRSGAFRTLIWKKASGPVIHQVTFESMVAVLQGSVTLSPLYGIPGKPVTVNAGDVLYLPGGVLKNMKPTEDTVILQVLVGSATSKPKGSVVRGKDLTEAARAEWMENDKPIVARTPEEMAKAPANAAQLRVKRYDFDGNSIRWVNLAKGGTNNPEIATRADTLVYVIKGRLRRTQGSDVFEVTAGDAVLERWNEPGRWDIVEDSQIIATDAPVRPAAFAPAQVEARPEGMNIASMLIDDNGRSYSGFVNIPMKKVSETESVSEKQAGRYWRIGYRTSLAEHSRSSKNYTSAAGPYEMHVGGDPHFVALMAGHLESTHQDGSVWRLAPGDLNYVCPGALHHSSYRSNVTGIMMNIVLPGTPADTKPPVFK